MSDDACSQLGEEYDSLEQEIGDLQDQLGDAAGAEKSSILREIGRLLQRATAAHDAYLACLAHNPPPPPPPPPVSSILSNATQVVSIDIMSVGISLGTATYTSQPQCDFMFSGGRDVVTVTSYSAPPIVERGAGGLCYDRATSTLVGHPSAPFHDGQMTLQMHFRIEHTNLLLLVGSDLDLPLSTAAPGGQPVGVDGRVVLVGSGHLTGALGGSPVTVTLDGWFKPVP